jgi:DNA-binding beta-propeller fold protein YncE
MSKISPSLGVATTTLGEPLESRSHEAAKRSAKRNIMTAHCLSFVQVAAAALFVVAALDPGDAHADDLRNVATVYVTNWRSNSVSRFDLTASGLLALREVVAAPAGSANALGAALSPDKQSLYVAQWGSGSLSQFQVQRDGGLTAVRSVPAAVPAPTDSAQVVVSPNGRRAYMTNFNEGAAGTLSIYNVDRELQALATIPTGGDGAAGMAMSAEGRTLYVAHMMSGDVTAFRIVGDRRPTRLGSWPAGQGTFVVALSPDGRRLWAANAISNDIASFKVQGDGRLSSDGPPTPVNGDGPRGIVVAPDGRALYIALYANGDQPGAVAAFRVRRSGGLEALDQPLLTGGNGAEAIALTRNGRRLLVANFNKGEAEDSVVTFGGKLGLRQGPFKTGGAEPDFGGLIVLPNR